MKLSAKLLILALIPGILFCRMDSDKLAEFEGGEITRGEFRLFIEAFKGLDSIPQLGIEAQESMLRDLAMMKLTGVAARKDGLDKSTEYSMQAKFKDMKVFLGALAIFLRRDVSDEKMEMIHPQLLFLKSSTPNSDDRKAEADEYAKKLNSGLSDAEVEKFIYEKNEMPRYRLTSGYLYPICVTCPTNQLQFLTEPLSKVKEKEFTVIHEANGFWIIRKYEDYKASADDFRSDFEEKFRVEQRIIPENLKKYQADQTAVIEKMKATDLIAYEEAKKNLEAELGAMSQLVWNEAKIEEQALQMAEFHAGKMKEGVISTAMQAIGKKRKLVLYPGINPRSENPDLADTTPLYSLDDKIVTYGDIKNRQELKNLPVLEQLVSINRILLPYELLKDHELASKVKDSDEAKFLNDLNDAEILSSIYVIKSAQSPEVTENEIQEYYNVRRFTEFQNRPLPAVREGIRRNLLQGKQGQTYQILQQKLIETYKLKIHKDKLAAGKI